MLSENETGSRHSIGLSFLAANLQSCLSAVVSGNDGARLFGDIGLNFGLIAVQREFRRRNTFILGVSGLLNRQITF